MGMPRSARVVYKRQGNPADLPDRLVSSRKRDRTDASVSGKSAEVSGKELAAPDGAVCPQTGAVPDDPEARPAQIVSRHAGRHVRPVVLDLEKRNVI